MQIYNTPEWGRVKISSVNQHLLDLLPSWQLSLNAEGKSPHTVHSYSVGVRQFFAYCMDKDFSKLTAQEWLVKLSAEGCQATTVTARRCAVVLFSRWLTDEGELDTDPMVGLKRPKLPTKVVPSLDDDEVRALIKACRGKSLRDRRDEALVRLMAETGLRAGEVIALRVDDVSLAKGLVIVQRGKGAKGRVAPFGPKTAAALDRYMRARKGHKLANTPALWLGVNNTTFQYYGLNRTLKLRAQAAGIPGFHPHRMRHTAASRWLRNGGSEQGLMAVAGWTSRKMLDRYTADTAAERAINEARQLNLGEL